MSTASRARHERRSHFRGKARTGHDLGVRYRAARRTEWVTAAARDIGAGGAFITTDAPEALESEIVLELVLPTSDQVFTLSATVRWTSPDGMGVQFTGELTEILIELTDYFATLTV